MHTINAFSIYMKIIVPRLIADISQNEQYTRNANREAAYVDGGISQVAPQITAGDFEIVL